MTEQISLCMRPSALCATDDDLACEVIDVALDAGIRVPEDIAVVGIGNLDAACHTARVPITSIDISLDVIAKHAVSALDALMRGKRPPASPTVIPPRGVFVRQSSDTIAVSHPALQQIVEHLQAHPGYTPSMEQLAEITGVSRRQLYNICHQSLGWTPAELLRKIRLNRVRNMLRDTDISIQEIAGHAGYGTVRTLNLEFLRTEQCTPRDWRRRMRGDS